MSMCYKTNDQAALAALADHQTKIDALVEQSREIGEKFDGKPIYSNNLGDVSFSGLALNNYHSREDKALWTAPDRSSGVSRPRTGRVKGRAAEVEDLRKRYCSMLPATVRFDPVWKAIGVDWGNLLFSGYHLFELNGTIYFKSSAPVGPVMTEILGSEFSKAVSEMKQGKA